MSDRSPSDSAQHTTPLPPLREVAQAILGQSGISDSTAELLWAKPTSATHGTGKPLSIYLDHLHWVSLAKARVGKPDGKEYQACYARLQAGVSSGRLLLPLSATHYAEVAGTVNLRRRTDVADVMSELSGFQTISNFSTRLACEFDAALHVRFGRPMFPRQLKPLGHGFAYVFGLGDGPQGKLVSTTTDGPPPDIDPAELADFEWISNQMAEYLMLRGPDPEQAALMPDYDPLAVKAVADQRARREQQLAELLKVEPTTRLRLEDIVEARGLYWELGPALPKLLSRAALSVDWFFAKGKDWISTFLEDLPCLEVQRTLTMQMMKNGSRAWSDNEMHDIDALAAAVPYYSALLQYRRHGEARVGCA